MRDSNVSCVPKILFAVTEDWYFWSHRKPLADYIKQQGWEVSVATRFNEYKTSMSTAGLECIALPFERSLRHPIRDLRTMCGLWWTVRRLRPDIVHLVSLKPILLAWIALLVHRRTQFFAAITGMGYLFSSQDRRARWARRVVLKLLRLLLRRSNAWVIVQNLEDLELLRAERLGDPNRTVLIPGVGVDTQVFAFAEVASAEQPIIVLPARLICEKGIEQFVAAARIVHRSNPQARFVLVGASDPDNPGAIPPAVIQAWVREGVIEWWGHRSDMPSVYYQARIVCLPSYREGMPKVLLEAAACGRPLIASDVAGCRDICRHEVTGTVVPARAIDPLAAAIIELLASPQLQQRYGRAGRAMIESEYSVERIGQQTLEAYRLTGAQVNAS